jgi:hypothetical protein
MQIERNELIQAIGDVLEQQAQAATDNAVTTRELRESRGWSEEYTRSMLHEALKRDIIQPVRVWRQTDAGYRTRVPGWQLCQSDSNS